LEDDGEAVRTLAASSLCWLGSRQGAPVLLKMAESSERDGLNSLNSLRQPEMWERLRGKALSRDLNGKIEELWRSLEKEVGTPVEGTLGREVTENPHAFLLQSREGRVSLLEALEEMTRSLKFDFILDSDRIRFVPRAEALEFWKKWLENL